MINKKQVKNKREPTIKRPIYLDIFQIDKFISLKIAYERAIYEEFKDRDCPSWKPDGRSEIHRQRLQDFVESLMLRVVKKEE